MSCQKPFVYCKGQKVLTVEAVSIFISKKLLLFLLGPVGMDWNKLNETLNPEFDWEAAVQTALKTDDSLENVSYCVRRSGTQT